MVRINRNQLAETVREELNDLHDYNKMGGKPQINGRTLQGNSSLEDLDIQKTVETVLEEW